jgi:hypothetical protein
MIIPTWLSSLANALKSGLEFIQQRTPFRIKAHVGRAPLTIVVSIINRTKDFPLHVHAVRVHFGMARYSSYFQLAPYDSVQIPPRGRTEFFLPFNDNIMGRRYETEAIPRRVNDPDEPPPWDSPAQLFLAIARGAPNDSWLEMDFNEFEQRRFLRGRLQRLFHTVTQCPPPQHQQ